MYIAHYLIPFIVIFIYLYFIKKGKVIKDKKLNFDLIKINKGKIVITVAGVIFFGLFLGNLIDFDHVYYRITGMVPWLGTSCGEGVFKCASFNFYPVHNLTFFFVFLLLSFFVFAKDYRIKFYGWIFIGAAIHLVLDFIQFKTGFGF
jgi:hypothetical protein